MLISDKFYIKSPNFIKLGWVTKKLKSKIYHQGVGGGCVSAPPHPNPSLIRFNGMKNAILEVT